MSGVQSVGRAFALLEALGSEPSSLTELAKRVELPISTTSRLLGTLEELGAVERLDGSSYRIGPSILNMVNGLDVTTRLQTLAGPELALLSERTDEAAGLSIPAGNQMHFVAQVDGDQPVQVKDWVGARLPMHLVSAGLVALTHQSQAFVDAYVERDLAGPTPRSITSAADIRSRLVQTARTGTAWTWEELELDINSVAAPITGGDGTFLGAVHLHGPASRFPGTDQPAFEAAVSDTATRLSSAMGT